MVRKDLFLSVLGQLLNGRTQDELSETLNACVQAVQETGKMAEIKLTLKIKPEGDGLYSIFDEIKAKIPEMSRGRTLMYGTPEGNLQRNDPKQVEIDFKVIEQNGPINFKNASNN